MTNYTIYSMMLPLTYIVRFLILKVFRSRKTTIPTYMDETKIDLRLAILQRMGKKHFITNS